jgi:hypothetical protein
MNNKIIRAQGEIVVKQYAKDAIIGTTINIKKRH